MKVEIQMQQQPALKTSTISLSDPDGDDSYTADGVAEMVFDAMLGLSYHNNSIAKAFIQVGEERLAE